MAWMLNLSGSVGKRSDEKKIGLDSILSDWFLHSFALDLDQP